MIPRYAEPMCGWPRDERAPEVELDDLHEIADKFTAASERHRRLRSQKDIDRCLRDFTYLVNHLPGLLQEVAQMRTEAAQR